MINRKAFRTLVFLSFCFATIGCIDSGKNNSKIENQSTIENNTQEWVSLMIEGYQNFNNDRSLKSANQIFKATELMPKKNLENYLVSAMVYAPNGENDKAFMSIERAIDEGFKDSETLNSIPEFSSLHSDLRWDSLMSKIDTKNRLHLKSIQNPRLLEELKEMWVQDQRVLSQYEENENLLDSTATSEDYRLLFEAVENRWEINKNKLDSIVKIHGWPGYKLVGELGAKIAWGIPQHHPDIFFKENCLTLIKEAVERNDTDTDYYAKLTDRIARETWQKQTYGSSMAETNPHPIKNPTEINKRRLELGLKEPIEVYAAYHGISYQNPTTEEAEQQSKIARDNALKDYLKFEQFISEKVIDSANLYLRKAIRSYGDITNEELNQASLKLAQTNNKQSKNLSLRIIKVLIWRKWKGRFDILKNDKFIPLHTDREWENIKKLLQKSE